MKYQEGKVVSCEEVVKNQLWQDFDLKTIQSVDKAYCGLSNGEEWYKNLKNNIGEIYVDVDSYDDFYAQLRTKEISSWYATFDAVLGDKTTKFKLINKSK